jgi:hypothetical protein
MGVCGGIRYTGIFQFDILEARMGIRGNKCTNSKSHKAFP